MWEGGRGANVMSGHKIFLKFVDRFCVVKPTQIIKNAFLCESKNIEQILVVMCIYIFFYSTYYLLGGTGGAVFNVSY